MRTRIIILPVTLLLLACICGPAAELVPVSVEKPPVEVVAGYSLGRPALSGLRLYGKSYQCRDDADATCYPTVVEQSVVKLGWNNDFILVERHPRDPFILATPDATNPSWFIIAISSGTIYKDLPYQQFIDLIESLDIPNIEMKNAMGIYKQ